LKYEIWFIYSSRRFNGNKLREILKKLRIKQIIIPNKKERIAITHPIFKSG
jgi:hypothetical protein